MTSLKAFLHGKETASLQLEAGQEYIVGRGERCAIQLAEQPGISRQHFKLAEQNGIWKASVLSKFGELFVDGQSVPEIELDSETIFKVAGYEFRFIESSVGLASAVSGETFRPNAAPEAPTAPAPAAGTLSLIPSRNQDFDGNEEATNVGSSQVGRPSLRIVKKSGSEQHVELNGKKWLAGREETCDVFLPDRKASRRQFEITSTPEGYFITDLGSANGTVLNGTPLIPEDPHQLLSGDVISVNALKIYFEVRDPYFEKKLIAISPSVLSAPLAPVAQYEMINYPMPRGPGGAVRVDSADAGGWESNDQRRTRSKNQTIRFGAIFVVVGVGLYAAFGTDNGSSPGKTEAPTGLARLTAQQRQTVKELYVTARNLYMQGKFENSHEQLKKLHEVLPEGYEGSKTMEEDCLAQRSNAEKLAFLEAEQKRVEEQKRIIDRNVRECNQIANRTLSVDEIRRCLSPTIGLDPTNPLVADLISRVERRAGDRTAKLTAQKDYREKVDRGHELHERGLALQKQGEWYPAIDAFNRHLAANLPDPDGLRAQSQQNVAKIKGLLVSKVEEAIASAETAYQGKNLKDALETAKRAKDIDPKSERVAEFIAKVRKELNSQLRSVYEDAILYEGVGQVKEAQNKWRQILDRDTADGEYFQKAKLKLRNYSDQGT